MPFYAAYLTEKSGFWRACDKAGAPFIRSVDIFNPN
jgi:hypothetical protein